MDELNEYERSKEANIDEHLRKKEKRKMPVIKITAADLAKVANIKSDWYSAEVIKLHDLSTAKSGKSINIKIDFLIHGAVTNGGEPINGKEITCTFNTELIGKLAPLYESATGKKVVPGEIDLDPLLHKKVDVKVGQRHWEGALIDEITAYLPLGKSKEAQPF